MIGPMITDFHTHILPGVDDGSADVAQSLEMLRLMNEQGVSRVVATPHFYATQDNPQRFLARRERAFAQLSQQLEAAPPRIVLGAEVSYFDGISDCEDLEKLTIGDTKYLLVEMPYPPWSDRMYRELHGIWQKRGVTPVVAHMDRYISPLRTFGIPEALQRLPVVVQVNTSFFLRRFTRSMALKLLREGRIHLLGSDCHNTSTRPPNLGKAAELIRKSAGEEALEGIASWEMKILGSCAAGEITL